MLPLSQLENPQSNRLQTPSPDDSLSNAAPARSLRRESVVASFASISNHPHVEERDANTAQYAPPPSPLLPAPHQSRSHQSKRAAAVSNPAPVSISAAPDYQAAARSAGRCPSSSNQRRSAQPHNAPSQPETSPAQPPRRQAQSANFRAHKE